MVGGHDNQRPVVDALPLESLEKHAQYPVGIRNLEEVSLERLLDFRFEWVLPGHEGRFRAASPAAMRRELERLIASVR